MRKLAHVLALTVLAVLAFSQTEPQRPTGSQSFNAKVVSATEIYTKSNDAPGAIKALTELRAAQPQDYYVNAWLGYLHLNTGNYAEAVGPLKTAHSVDAKDLGVMANLALALDKTGDKAGCFDAYKELNTLKPKDATVLNKLGVLSLERQDLNGAVRYFEEADAAAPGDKFTTMNLATAYQRAGANDKAQASYERLIGMNPDNETMVTALSWLGFAAIQAKQYDKAVGHLERASSMRANDLEVLNNLANAYSNLNPPQDAKAADIYRKMVALDPNLYEPWYNLGVLYLKQGKADEAVDANQNALRRKPDEAFALNNLGRAYEMQGRHAMAGDNYAKASLIDPNNVTFAHNAAVAYANAKMDDKAAAFIDKAMKLGDKDPDLMLILGEIYARTGRTAEGAALLERASERVQNRADLWFNLGVMKEKLGQKAEAEDCYAKCLAIKPDDMDANTNLALLMLDRGDWRGATPLLEKVYGLNSSGLDAKINLAAVYYRAGRVKEAIGLWKDVLHTDEKRTDVRLNLANALWAQGDYDGAHNQFVIASKERPNDAQVLNGMGLWQLRQAKNADAEKSFRAAVKSNGKYMPSYNNLAVTLERLNRKREAIAVLEQALKIDPEFEDARKNLLRLKGGEN